MLWQFACRRKTSLGGAIGAPSRRCVRGISAPVNAVDLKKRV
jgi:hypothetical protein